MNLAKDVLLASLIHCSLYFYNTPFKAFDRVLVGRLGYNEKLPYQNHFIFDGH